MKDKTFIFGDYEGVRQSKSQSANVNVPSANARAGIFANGDVITPDPNITRLLALYPLPANARGLEWTKHFVRAGIGEL